MTYIELINNFWRLDEDWQFTCCETRLYFYLLKTANRLGWVNSWTRSDAKVSSDVGVSANSMKTARNRLVQAGLIEFKSGGKGQRDKTRYQILIPKPQPKLTPNLIPKPQPNHIPNALQYNVRALDIDKDNNFISNAQVENLFPPDNIFDKPLNDCYQELQSNESWKESFCMNTRSAGFKDFTPEIFDKMLKLFFMKLQNEGVEKKSTKDAMSYFNNWVKYELKNNKNESKVNTKCTGKQVIDPNDKELFC